MHIDRYFHTVVDPKILSKVPSVRFLLDVSREKGYQDLNHTFNDYDNWINGFNQTKIMILNHETYGEGWKNWELMNDNDWRIYFAEFTNFVKAIFQHYKGKNFIYELWNEGDQKSKASVYIKPHLYGEFFIQVQDALKQIDPAATLMNGGWVTGAGDVANYFAQTGLVNRSKVINVHPYGQGGNYPLYKHEGHIADYLNLLHNRYPNHKIRITEFGVLKDPNLPREPIANIIDYAISFKAVTDARSYVIGLDWYALYDGQDDGHGAFSGNTLKIDNKGRNLLSVFEGAIVQPPTPPVSSKRPMLLQAVMNLRSSPAEINGKDNNILVKCIYGTHIVPTEETVYNEKENRYWRMVKVTVDGVIYEGWMACLNQKILL